MDKDRAAFETFFGAYFPRLYRFCRVRMADEAACEDIVQETLTRALAAIDGYRGEASMFTWLCQICRHRISDHVERHGGRRSVTVSLDDDPAIRATLESLASDDVDPADAIGVTRMVQVTLDYLPDHYGRVLEWKYIEGLSVEEIADRLDTGVVAVQSVLARARAAFRDAFETLRHEPA